MSHHQKPSQAHKKKPFTISREANMRPPASGDKRPLFAVPESQSRALALSNRNDPQIEAQNKILASQTAFKNCYNLFKVSPNLLPELLQKYAEANLKYRDEEFTQQGDNFLTKIAASKKIPKELKARYPIYYILVSICKIFMLNEYEIIVLACALDHCSWKIEETVYPDEEGFLKEFPGNLGTDIDSECKRLIIYLLVITFSLKQYLNEKSEVDKIHAYCENICTNFQAIFNRWTRVSFYHKFNYSPLEINRKFRYLCQKEDLDLLNTNKDYNTIVDSIMGLTGAYKSKITIKSTPMNASVPPQQLFHHSTVFPDFQLPPLPDNKVAFTGIPVMSMALDTSAERGLSKTLVIEPVNTQELEQIPEFESLSRRMSSSTNLFEDHKMKKQRLNSLFPTFPGFSRENSMFKEFSTVMNNNANTFRNIDTEEFMNNIMLPALSKRSSISQAGDEPNFFRFHSILSSWQKE